MKFPLSSDVNDNVAAPLVLAFWSKVIWVALSTDWTNVPGEISPVLPASAETIIPAVIPVVDATVITAEESDKVVAIPLIVEWVTAGGVDGCKITVIVPSFLFKISPTEKVESGKVFEKVTFEIFLFVTAMVVGCAKSEAETLNWSPIE